MDERRTSPRHAVRIQGKLISPDMLCCVDVVIADLSEQGALVRAASAPAAFPDRGYLWQAKTSTLFEFTVQWRKGGKLFGLRFTDAANRDRLRQLIGACAIWPEERHREAPPYRVVSARAA